MPINRVVSTFGIISLLASGAWGEEINLFTGKSEAQISAGAQKRSGSRRPGIGKPKSDPSVMSQPPVPPPPVVGSQPQNSGLVPKRSTWRILGRLDDKVSVANSISGAITIVSNGDVLDGCIVDYPSVNCDKEQAVVRAKQNVVQGQKSLAAERVRLDAERNEIVQDQRAVKAKLEKDAVEKGELEKKAEAALRDKAEAEKNNVGMRAEVERLRKELTISNDELVMVTKAASAKAAVASQQPPEWFTGSHRYFEKALGELDVVSATDGRILAVRGSVEKESFLDSALAKYVVQKVTLGEHVYYKVSGLVAKKGPENVQ